MTTLTEWRAGRSPVPLPLPSAALGAFILAAVSTSSLIPARADTPTGGHQGRILAMKTVHTGRLISYDITVTSPDEFPMRDEIVTLSIGGQTFSNSHYLSGGDLNTLVFSLTQKQFQSFPAGTAAVVYYGQDDAAISKAQWVLGTSDKSILDKIQIGIPVVISPARGGPIVISPIAAGPIATLPGVLVSRVKTGLGSASNTRAASNTHSTTHAASRYVVPQQKGKK